MYYKSSMSLSWAFGTDIVQVNNVKLFFVLVMLKTI